MTAEAPTAVVVGASDDRSKYGNKAVRAYAAEGWKVIPVNPRGGSIEGLRVARRLDEIPDAPDRILVYLPPSKTLALLPELAAAGAGEVWFNPGSADGEVLARARELGIPVRSACSIVDIGRSPSEFA